MWRVLVLIGLAGCDGFSLSLPDGVDFGVPVGQWEASTYPCVGSRTDAILFELYEGGIEGFVGCGSVQEGQGLFQTVDGGTTWREVSGFEEVRVSSLSRDTDGLLLVAGTGPGTRVWRYDGTISPVYSPPDRPAFWQTFHVGTFRMDSTGRAIAESLTGTSAVYWPDGMDQPLVNGDGWFGGGDDGDEQILDLEVHNDRFIGVGARISQPHYLYREPASGMGDAMSMEVVQLSARTGEMWDVAVDRAGALIAAGVDQVESAAILYTADSIDQDDWDELDVRDVIGASADATRFYGACRDGNRIAAVGDYSRTTNGLLLLSTDGRTFQDVALPTATDTLTRCQFVGDTLIVAGANGFVARLGL
jgi:hypothetical protein